MPRTYEALMKAKTENMVAPEGTEAFDSTPPSRPSTPLNLNLPPHIAEEYQRMKHHLAGLFPSEQAKTLIFTSSTRGEGTTTVITNFAVTLATGGESVLLVDVNLRYPALHKVFNLERKGGITDVLLGNASLESAIKKTVHPAISLITSGTPHPNLFSLFEPRLLNSFMDQLKSQAEWVLLDTPAVNHYDDFRVLADKTDGTLLVVEAENTRWEVAQHARERIENGRMKILGVILNRRKLHIPKWVYRML